MDMQFLNKCSLIMKGEFNLEKLIKTTNNCRKEFTTMLIAL